MNSCGKPHNEKIGRKGLDEIDGCLHDAEQRGHIEVIEVRAVIRLAVLVGHVETNNVDGLMLRVTNQSEKVGSVRKGTNPSDKQKESGRDHDQTDVPAIPSPPLVDKDPDAADEENKVYPLKK